MINDYEKQLLECIDEQIDSATDDDLFAGGYLRGHISLAAAACEDDDIHCVEEFKRRIVASLDAAKSELTPADQVIVLNLWHHLQKQVD